MRAVRLHEVGGPQNLVLEEVARPQAQRGEVLVRISHAALNHRDIYIPQGLYPGIELPRILGSDGCGVVAAHGPHAQAPAVGAAVVINPMLDWGPDQRVWDESSSLLGMPRDGTFAQYVTGPAENVVEKPPGLTNEEAAAIPLAGLTAYRALVTRGKLSKNETLLVTGIGGGVATFVLLFAKQIGARVVVTSSSNEKLSRARELGADEIFNYKENPDWHKAAKRIRIDLAVDSSGGETFAKVLDFVKPGGRVVTYGGTNGNASIRPFSIFWKHLDVLGSSMGSPADFSAMLQCFDGDLRPVIARVSAMEDVAAAAQRMDDRAQFGKIVFAIPA